MKSPNNIPVIIKAIHDVRKRQYAIKKEQDSILIDIKNMYQSESFTDFTIDHFPVQFKTYLKSCIGLIKQFNCIAENYKVQLPSGVIFNKMVQVLEGVCAIADETLCKIVSGNKESIFNNDIPVGLFPKLGTGDFWGSSNSTFYSAALTSIYYFLKAVLLKLPKEKGLSANSPIVFSFAMPEETIGEFATLIAESLGHPYIDISEREVVFKIVHSGFTRGGFYGAIDENYVYRPHSCSSFIEESYKLPNCLYSISHAKGLANTSNLLCAARWYTNRGYIPHTWSDFDSMSTVELLEPVTLERGNLGSIMLLRRFNDDFKLETSLGKSGHLGIICGRKNEDLAVIATSRHIPEEEGFGLQFFSIEDNSIKTEKELYCELFAFNPTGKILDRLYQEEFTSYIDMPYSSLEDLPIITSYFDNVFLYDIL